MDGIGRYRLLGRTVDDADGEAFDKGANLLKLGYPGGPVIDRTARDGNPKAVTFPRGFVRKLHSRITGLDPRLCVSFSGLKTALLYHLRDHPNLGSALKNQESGLTPATGAGNLEFQGLTPMGVADLAASYQEAIVDTLVQRATRIAESNTKVLAVVGGVSLNRRLREKMTDMAAKRRLQIVLAAPAYCTDNAAMVAGLAAHKLAACPPLRQAMLLDADPNLGIGEP
jgi:N6-L-threonylcarbamoyladenine synthase